MYVTWIHIKYLNVWSEKCCRIDDTQHVIHKGDGFCSWKKRYQGSFEHQPLFWRPGDSSGHSRHLCPQGIHTRGRGDQQNNSILYYMELGVMEGVCRIMLWSPEKSGRWKYRESCCVTTPYWNVHTDTWAMYDCPPHSDNLYLFWFLTSLLFLSD